MDTQQLERLLEGAEETDRLEFKRAMDWDRNSLVKDILAMSNVQNGGQIVFGIEDGTLQRQGLTAQQIATFDSDTIKDQISPFADPAVRLRLYKVKDQAGRDFVVIDVFEFEEFPIICRRDGYDVKRGDIYFRSLAQKPQSARVSEASDLRHILDRAVVRRMQNLQRLGFVAQAESPLQEQYDAELGGL